MDTRCCVSSNTADDSKNLHESPECLWKTGDRARGCTNGLDRPRGPGPVDARPRDVPVGFGGRSRLADPSQGRGETSRRDGCDEPWQSSAGGFSARRGSPGFSQDPGGGLPGGLGRGDKPRGKPGTAPPQPPSEAPGTRVQHPQRGQMLQVLAGAQDVGDHEPPSRTQDPNGFFDDFLPAREDQYNSQHVVRQ